MKNYLDNVGSRAGDGHRKLFKFKRIYDDQGVLTGWLKTAHIIGYQIERFKSDKTVFRYRVIAHTDSGKSFQVSPAASFKDQDNAIRFANDCARNGAERQRLTFLLARAGAVLGLITAILAIL